MELTITTQQGQTVLNFLQAGIRMPEKLGKGDDAESFDVAERGFLDDQMRRLRETLVSYSTRTKDTKQFCFGGVDKNWKLERPEHCPSCRSPLNGLGKAAYDMVDGQALVKIKLEDGVEEGLFWVLALMAHPDGPAQISLQLIDEVVWPLARLIEMDKMLAKTIRLDKRKGRKLLKNDAREWGQGGFKKVDLEGEPQKEAVKA